MVFVFFEHQFRQMDHLCITERQHLVYRRLAEGPAAIPPGEPAPTDADCTVS